MSAVPVLKSCLDLPIEEDKLKEVIEKAIDWALMHGCAMRSKIDFNSDALQFAPFILLPSSFPRSEFVKATELQTTLNELMHNVAHDFDFLRSTISSTIQVDTFTANLFKIFETVAQEGISQPLSLGLLRSDLMLETVCGNESNSCSTDKDMVYCCWKQVEINTIASGFGHLGPASKDLQSFILSELGVVDKLPNLPENLALSGLCGGMIEAWRLAGKPKAVILFVIEEVSYNICDQRFHEFEIRATEPSINIIRKTLTYIHEHGSLGPNKELLIDNVEVSVVYFRSGYEPNQYPTDKEWDARLLMERSSAIKCPSIYYHLAGTKKIQQALARPGILKRFIKDENKIRAINKIFTGLYSLDKDEQGEATVQMALKNPDLYVLKPQREGGGNNIYGQDIKDALTRMTEKERSAWILMERILPPISKGYMVRPGSTTSTEIVDLVSELGIFGVIIGDKDKILSNKQVGHMLRTKISTANEGGVAAGLGALDSPYLID